MIKNILIVTYHQDWLQCSTSLLPSISKYVPGATVKIVDTTLPEKSLLLPNFDNISCEIINFSSLLTNYPAALDIHNFSGWIRQQLCKLAGYKLFNELFVIIDSEIEILQPIESWPNFERGGNTVFFEFVEEVKKKFNITDLNHNLLLPQVPFIMNPKILKKIINYAGSENLLFDWFIKQAYPSEFVLYDLFANQFHPKPEIRCNAGETCMQYVLEYPYTLDPIKYQFALVDRTAWKEKYCKDTTISKGL